MAEMKRWTVLDKDGNAANTILWDGETKYAAPEGQKLVPEVLGLIRVVSATQEDNN